MKKIMHYLAALMLVAGIPTHLYADGDVTLYGDVIYSDNWEESSDYGVYSINASTGAMTMLTPSSYSSYFNARNGAVYKDGHFYTIDSYNTWYDFNTDSWDEENEDEATFVAYDMTVNPTDNKIYGAIMTDEGESGQKLATITYGSSPTIIGTLSTSLATISADAYGQLYGIGTDGVLYKIDATTAEETSIGSTGITPAGMQSATFDYGTGTLYWAASTSMGVGALYSVDITTGKATRVARFSGNEQIVGLYSLSSAKAWEGPDMPDAPTDVQATYSNGQSVITWTAPTKGLHNGDFDAADTKYDVVRLPDSTVVASNLTETTYTDVFTPTQLGAYTYEVTAKNTAGTGGSAKSNVIVAGNAITPPYAQDFTDESTFALLTMVDGDGDGSTWEALTSSHCAHDAGAPFDYTNDWLFTPRLSLKADRLYRLRSAVSAPFAANYPYNVKATVGTAPTQTDTAFTIQEITHISVPDTTQLGGYFKVDADGEYYVGINTNGYDIQDILLHYLYIDEGPKLTAPDSVTTVTAKADADGSSHVAFSFTAPTRTVNGDVLSSISSIKVYRGETLVATIDNVTPGNTYTAEDNAPTANTFNSYSIVAENAEGEGLAYETTVFVGIDTPEAPANVKAAYDLNNDGKVIISWSAPTIGVNGGYVNPDYLTFDVARYIGTGGNLIVSAYKDTTYTDDIDNTGEQAYQIYGVAAQNGIGGISSVSRSNYVIKGAPYTLPFNENFPNGSKKYLWISTNTPSDGYASWSSYNGIFSFSQSYKEGDASTIASGKIDPSGAVNPILEYEYWYRAEGGSDSLNVYLIKNGTDTVLVDDEPYTLFMNAKDFEKVTVPLKDYIDADTKFIQVAFSLRTYADGATQMAGVRNIVVRDQQDYDLEAAAISSPANAVSGDTIAVLATVHNYGSKTADTYTVDLMESGKVIATQQGGNLASDSVKVFTFNVPVTTLKDTLNFAFAIDYDYDLVESNNESEEVQTYVTLPVYPVPTEGKGIQNGNSQVDITWKAPDYEDFTLPVTDGADDYETFAISNFGEWTVRDLDGKATRDDLKNDNYYDLTYTHKGEPMAWIVMNPDSANASLTNWWGGETGWRPVSGNQFFASISSAEGGNDDWLISPELSGEAQTISFYQHGYYGMEQYEVLYSSTDTTIASFTRIDSTASASTWTQVRYDLPEGAKYFAIRNLGADYSQYFFIDDINFKPKSNVGVLKLNGYNIYRDGEKIGTVGAEETSFSDIDVVNGDHTYQVTAVYNLGESASTTIEVSVATSIDAINGTTGKSVLQGSRLVSNGNAEVYTLDGKMLFHGNAANGVTLPKGTYIIKADGQTVKAVVR